MDDLARFCCQNPECSCFGQRGLDNLTVCDRYGHQQEHRLLRCKTCKARFSERKGTPLFGARLPESEVVGLLAHLAEGCGVRKTSRLLKVNKNTVIRYAALAGQHAKDLHDELVAFSPPNAGSAVRRKVVVRGQEGKTLRPRRARRHAAGR